MGVFRFSKMVTSTRRLDGQTAVVTGCNTGIGKETVKDLVKRGCRVVMACRTTSKADEAAKEIRKATADVEGVGVMVVVCLDLSSLASVRECAVQLLKDEDQINILINNAGVMICPYALTEDGYEMQFATNHLGHFLFTLLLLPRIIKSKPARIVIVSSVAHIAGNINFDDLNWRKSYSKTLAYSQSKLANILFAKELAKRLKEHGHGKVTTYALHPGVINTELPRHVSTALWCGNFLLWYYRNVLGVFLKSPLQGAQTSIHCAVDEGAGKETGLYYADARVSNPNAKARDQVVAARLWDVSVKMVQLEDFDPFTANDRLPFAQPMPVPYEQIMPVPYAQSIVVQPKRGWE